MLLGGVCMKKRLWIICAICLGSMANAHIKSETSSGGFIGATQTQTEAPDITPSIKSETSSGGFVGDLQADSTDIKQTRSIQK